MDEELLYRAELSGQLRLSARGEWFHDGVAFSNPRLIELFNRSITRSGAGAWCLRIGRGEATFTCEDTPWFVTVLEDTGSPWQVTLSDGTSEALTPTTLRLGAAGQVYCRLLRGDEARFTGGAHQRLLSHTVDEEHLLIDGQLIPLGAPR